MIVGCPAEIKVKENRVGVVVGSPGTELEFAL